MQDEHQVHPMLSRPPSTLPSEPATQSAENAALCLRRHGSLAVRVERGSGHRHARSCHRLQRVASHLVEDGTRHPSKGYGFAFRDGTRAEGQRAVATPRADWICGRQRAGPFILPSLSAPRIRSRLRRTASSTRCAGCCPRGSCDVAHAACCQRVVCTIGGDRSAGSAAVRQLARRTVRHVAIAHGTRLSRLRQRDFKGRSRSTAARQRR
jgi:hypothetical protein